MLVLQQVTRDQAKENTIGHFSDTLKTNLSQTEV